VPPAQLTQVELFAALWYVPAAQLLQDAAEPSLKVPATQLEQLVFPEPS